MRDLGVEPGQIGRRDLGNPGESKLLDLALDRVHEIAIGICVRMRASGSDSGPFGPPGFPEKPIVHAGAVRGLKVVYPRESG